MAGADPLLAQRPSSEASSRDAEEEEALLSRHRRGRNAAGEGRGQKFWREVGLFAWAFVATVIVIILGTVYQHEQSSRPKTGGWGPDGKPTGKRNLIFMVSDGMGPTSLSMTRSFMQLVEELPYDEVLTLDQHIIGTSRTRSSSSLVTDSAAGATAFSCGFKSYNGAISVLPNHDPCGTVLEAAKAAGYMTGLVVTTRITDATPATFASHVNLRQYEDEIALQEIGEHPLGHVVDLLMGGGRCHFLPNTTTGSCRADDTDVIAMAKKNGYNYVSDRKGFDDLEIGSSATLPLLALFADMDIPYEIDRRNEPELYPSLDEMAQTALAVLSAATKDSDKGFFIMIEGSRIDHAGHGNDPAAQVHEVLAYDEAFSSVLEFLKEDDTEGVLVATSDHETGGLSAARQLHTTYPDYLWYPSVLANASNSAERAALIVYTWINEHGTDALESYLTDDLFPNSLGIVDVSEEELENVVRSATKPEGELPLAFVFSDMVSRRAQIGWSTHGHSAVDVNIYASAGEHAPQLRGNHENVEIGKFLASYLDVDVDAITQKLNEARETSTTNWLGSVPEAGSQVLEGIDDYHGDFRKRGIYCGHEH